MLTEEDKKRKKWEYYFANLICEVYNFRQMWAEKPKYKWNPEEFFVKYEEPAKTTEEDDRQSSYLLEEETEKNGEAKEKLPTIEPGPEVMEHPGWAKVNEDYKKWFTETIGVEFIQKPEDDDEDYGGVGWFKRK